MKAGRGFRRALSGAALAAASFLACGQTLEETSFSLKGYFIGMAMESCPDISVPGEGHLRGTLHCSIPIDTLGGLQATTFVVSIWNGQVFAMSVVLRERGRYAGGALVAALSEKFGRPDTSRAHLNEYQWRRAGQQLSFDGYKGSLVATDRVAIEELRRLNAQHNKKDL